MWHGGDGHNGVEALRHECSEGNGVGPYGWTEHDGRSFGKQDIVDDKAGVRLVTSVVKPAQLKKEGSAALGADEETDGMCVCTCSSCRGRSLLKRRNSRKSSSLK